MLGVGCGRSYGDSNLNFGHALVNTSALDRIIAFDASSGVLRAEAGMTLGAVLRFSVPRGWFLPTSPGTRFVTLAGAVANDVHGKNHHRAGSFGCAVRRIGLLRSDRGYVELSPDETPELFAATIAGLGLTGLILWVEFQLAPVASAFLDQETIVFPSLRDFFALSLNSENFEHIVAWVDCTARGRDLGRGIFSRANWRRDGDLAVHDERRRLTVPPGLAGGLLNRASLRMFNQLYFNLHRLHQGTARTHYAPSIYPLDTIGRLNRLYGPRGFYQYQCVVPMAAAEKAVRELLLAITASGVGSFLAVLKTLGSRPSPGLLSFPREGTTLALDFANQGAPTLALMAKLDSIVSTAGGRLYPAKDGRIPSAMFQAGYPELGRFRANLDPAFSSNFWRRVGK
jgi:L-gulonolactone oxidase